MKNVFLLFKAMTIAAFLLLFIACISKKQPIEIALPNTVVADSLPPQNQHIRGRFKLIDSLGISCSTENNLLHLFQVNELAIGYYPKDSIYICSRRKDLYQFNNHMNPDAVYWWVLSKTEDSIHKLPIYRHSGNF